MLIPKEKREPADDINIALVDSLKALDPNGRLEKRTLVWHVRSALFPAFFKTKGDWVAPIRPLTLHDWTITRTGRAS